jgi:phage terminase large subunit-like protein
MSVSLSKDQKALKEFREKCARIRNATSINPLESITEKQQRIKRALDDFKFAVGYYFEHYSESETPDFHIRIARKVRRSKKYKGWLKWARGHAKSVVANLLLPIWLWMNGDIQFMIVIGQNEDKAKILVSDIQAEFEHNQRLINDFGSQKVAGSWEHGFFITASGFAVKALGMGQDPRGLRIGPRRPDYISCDDWESKETVKNPMRQDEYAEWLLRGVIPSMDNKNRRVLICQNHFAPRMIFSKIIEEHTSWDVDTVNGYNPVTYEPTWKEKYHRWFFKEVEDEIGTLAALAEYNNAPHVEGKIFTDKHIQWCKLPPLKSMTTITSRWDVAYAGTATSDFNAVRDWGLKDGRKYLIDCYVRQSKIKDALRWIAERQIRMAEKGILIQTGFESQFWNEEVYRNIEEIEQEYGIMLNLIKIERRKGNKFDDMLTMLPQYENGRIYYNEVLKSHKDTQTGIAQLKGLEPGYRTKDDAPDADKYAFDYLDSFEVSATSGYRIRKAESRKY